MARVKCRGNGIEFIDGQWVMLLEGDRSLPISYTEKDGSEVLPPAKGSKTPKEKSK